jgi:hypothetical protein
VQAGHGAGLGVVDVVTTRTTPAPADGTSGRLAGVPTFTVYVALRAATAVDDATVDTVTAALRPGDAELRVWREPDRAVLRASTECDAADLEAALGLAHALGAELGELCPGDVLEAAALDDEDSMVWRGEP